MAGQRAPGIGCRRPLGLGPLRSANRQPRTRPGPVWDPWTRKHLGWGMKRFFVDFPRSLTRAITILPMLLDSDVNFCDSTSFGFCNDSDCGILKIFQVEVGEEWIWSWKSVLWKVENLPLSRYWNWIFSFMTLSLTSRNILIDIQFTLIDWHFLNFIKLLHLFEKIISYVGSFMLVMKSKTTSSDKIFRRFIKRQPLVNITFSKFWVTHGES